VEEFLTVVVIRQDIASYVFTLLILFPAFLTLVYFSSRLIDRSFHHEPAIWPLFFMVSLASRSSGSSSAYRRGAIRMRIPP
jgi:hypothetical protein